AAPLKSSRLFKRLDSKNAELAARVLLIREQAALWLPHITQLFPHYPSHGVDHSDRIVAQLSRLLFNGERLGTKLSTAEIYCLLCASYLHDAGMVVTATQAADILSADSWKAFVGPGGAGESGFSSYIALRDGPVLQTAERTAFLANRALLYVL